LKHLGAQGASGNPSYVGGRGARMSGDFDVVPGSTIIIAVGGQGQGQSSNSHGGGGGGSFVVIEDATSPNIISVGPFAGTPVTPLVIAGGGAGTRAACAQNGNPGLIGINGGAGIVATTGGGGPSGVTPGMGGTIFSSWGSAGAGFIGNGANDGTFGCGGKSFLNGAAGGADCGSCGVAANGGFGGGGQGRGCNGGGGGGGYTGGGGGWCAGGGGSFNSGTLQDNEAGFRTGNGQVTIQVLCLGLTTDIPVTGVCIGEELTLFAESTSGGEITWDLGVDNGTPFAPPLGTTTYTATSSSLLDCGFTIDISASEIPDITANSSSPAACEGTFITLWGENGDTYTWDMGVTDSVPFPAPVGTVTYTVTGSILGCEGPPASITLEGAAQPDIAGVATPAQICLGESFVLTGEGDAATYNWGATIDDGDEVTPATAGTFAYVVIGNSDVGCGDTAIVYVTVFGLPEVNGGSDVAVCEGEEVTLTGSGAPTLEWSPMITDGEPFEAMAGANVYTLTGTDANGCEDTDEVTVTGVEVPVITDAVVTDEFFGYDGSIDITVEGGSGAYTYEWSHGPVSQDVGSLTAGTYTVIVNDITVEKGLCETEGTYEIGSFVGLEDQSLVNLNVYPNPVVDEFTIATEGTFNYDVVNLLGEVVLSGQGTTSVQVSMKDFANGTYIVKVKSGEQTGFVQVVKQ
jgi:hypothetical protein